MERLEFNPALERLDRDEVRALQFQRLTALLTKTWGCNPFYRERWQKAGVALEQITSLEAFTARVPTVEKKDFFQDQLDEPPLGRRHTHALSLGEPLVICTTSGTSGQGVEVHAQTESEFRTTCDIYRYGLTWAGLKRAERLFLTLPITMMTGGRAEYHGAVAHGLSVFPTGNYDAAKKLELLERFKPVALFGTTSYFGHLAAVAGREPASESMRVLLTGGEGSGFAWLERLEQSWGARVYDRYGSTQSGNDHAFSCEHGIGKGSRPGMIHNIDPLVLIEVVDPETGKQVKDGEPGEIVLTSLYHTDTPIIRCRMRDRGVWRDARYCGCGRAFSGFEVATIGRMDDMRKVKGVNIWPQSVDQAMFSAPEVDEYQIVLTSDAGAADVATAQIMPKFAIPPEESPAVAGRLARMLQTTTGIHFAVELVPPGALARSEYKAKRWLDQRLHARR